MKTNTIVLNQKLLKGRNTSSNFRGVFAKNKKWRALIRFEGKLIHLGVFENEEDAARAYDCKALELFGAKFANLNFPHLPKSEACCELVSNDLQAFQNLLYVLYLANLLLG